MLKKLLLTASLALSSTFAFAHNLALNQALPKVDITEKGELILNNDKISYQAWNTSKLVGKVRIIQAAAGRMSSKKMNAHVIDAIIAEKFPKENYQTTSIVDQKDILWGTSGFVKSSLEESKKTFSHSSMVLDSEGKIANAWQLKKESSAIILLDNQGKVQFVKEGKLSTDEVKLLIEKTKTLIKTK